MSQESVESRSQQSQASRITILVNQQPHHIEQDTVDAQLLRQLVGAPANYEAWRIVKDPDPEGQLPLDDEQVIGSIPVKSGERFRVVPPGTFGEAPALTTEHLAAELRQAGWQVSTFSHGSYRVIILKDYPLDRGWNKTTTNLLLKVPPSFPYGKPDMFWTDEDLALADGSVPRKADKIEQICSQRWRRFSWHTQAWNPGRDDIHTFIAFVARRLAQRE